MKPTKLRCEYLERPIGIDVRRPRFSWIFDNNERAARQESYRILVAGNPASLARNQADKWDSGRVRSDRNVNISYEGEELASGETCYWKVGVWAADQREAVYSDPTTFEMGLLEKTDWKAEWISSARRFSAPFFRKQFHIGKSFRRARAYVSGLGYYELYLNGQKVDERVLDPAPTYYNLDVPDKIKSRVLYSTFDVTDSLDIGENVAGCILGNGWYSFENDAGGGSDFRESFSEKQLLILQLEVEYDDGEKAIIGTDTSWKVSASPIVYNDFCHGEQYDARLEKPGWNESNYEDSEWDPAVKARAPSGKLCAQMLPPQKVMRTIKPVSMAAVREGVYVFDFGQHFSGWTRLTVSGRWGNKVVLRHAGRLYPDGTLDTRNNWGSRQSDAYVLRGAEEEQWEPRFTLHGFQYVEMTGFPGAPDLDSLEGCVVYSSVESESEFSCSNDLVDRIHRNVWWTLMTSFQGMPQDAAERTERVAWTGDPGCVVDDYLLNFDSAPFWTKWLDDLNDSQTADGMLPHVSPPFGWRFEEGSNETWPFWNATYPICVWKIYEYYDDIRILERQYKGIRRLVDHFGAVARNGIIEVGLGDHMEPQEENTSFTPVHTPVSVTSTAYYYYCTWIVSQAAKVLKKKKDSAKYADLAGDIRAAFNREFFNGKTAQYATGSQTSNALALLFDFVPEDERDAVLDNLVDDIVHNHSGHLSTGIIGTAALNQVLPGMGRPDVMHEILMQKSWPGWIYEIENGATTVWECWDLDDTHSLNMKMFCSTDKYCYGSLAGIWPLEPGFRKARIRPLPVDDVNHVSASVATIRGMFCSDWRRNGKSFALKVAVPANCEAVVYMPISDLRDVDVIESGMSLVSAGEPAEELTAGQVTGIAFGGETNDSLIFEVGSGTYEFVAALPERDQSSNLSTK